MRKMIDNHPLVIMLICSILFFIFGTVLIGIGEIWIEDHVYNERTMSCLYTADNLFEDTAGNLWSYSNEEIEPGVWYEVTFNDQGTNSIYDDVIVEVRKL